MLIDCDTLAGSEAGWLVDQAIPVILGRHRWLRGTRPNELVESLECRGRILDRRQSSISSNVVAIEEMNWTFRCQGMKVAGQSIVNGLDVFVVTLGDRTGNGSNQSALAMDSLIRPAWIDSYK